MTSIDEVSKTGMAIDLARQLINKGKPQGEDLSPEYNYAQWAPLYNLAHSGIENGIKALIRRIEGDHPSGHNLRNLLRKLKGKAPKIAQFLEDAFSDIVNFYTIDKSRYAHFESLDTYLNEYGSEDRYETYRYWALENRHLHHIPLFVHRELLWVLGELCQWGIKRVTSRRVEQSVRWSVTRAVEKHINRCNICTAKSPGAPFQISQEPSPLSTAYFSKLIERWCQYFKISSDECFKQVNHYAIQHLKGYDDPAVRHYISRLDDLPEGSVPFPCDVELEVNWPVDTYGIVKIRDGERLGAIRSTIDGRWFTLGPLSEYDGIFAKTTTDAMNWLVKKHTEVIDVSVDSGPHTPMRVMSPATLGRSRAGDGPWSPFKITIVDHSHGLRVGQRIDVRIGHPIPVMQDNGIISRVDGGLVEFGD